MKHFLFFLISLILILLTKERLHLNVSNQKSKKLKNDTSLLNWLKKLKIKIPSQEFSIWFETLKIEEILIDHIQIGKIESFPIIEKNQKLGINITIDNISLNILTDYKLENISEGKIEINASEINAILPFKIIKNKTNGLISNVNISGLNMTFNEKQLNITIKGSGFVPYIIQYLIDYYKTTLLNLIFTYIDNEISNLVEIEFKKLFTKINDMIIFGAEPIPLISIVKKPVDLRNSSFIDTLRFLFDNLIGIDGPLNLNHLFSIFTNGRGDVIINNFINNSIKFNYIVSDSKNNTIGKIQFGLNDLNISGLNTWTGFQAFIPNEKNPIRLDSFTNLSHLVINITLSINATLDKNTEIFYNDAILNEEIFLHLNLTNNTLMTQLQLPTYSGKIDDYSHIDCLTMSCLLDLIDSNGTGFIFLNANETFNNIIFNFGKGELEEEIDNLISQIIKLFLDNYKNNFQEFFNALFNSTLTNLLNNYIHDYLFSAICSKEKDIMTEDVNIPLTTGAIIIAFLLFFLIIFFPYIIGNGCKKQIQQVQLPFKNEIENISNISRSSNINYVCYYNCNDWFKEFGRFDSEGSSLFLNSNINIFWRIIIPLVILFNIAFFISFFTTMEASIYILLTVGREIKVPPILDFTIINSITGMCQANVYLLSLIIAFLSGIWPCIRLLIMLIIFLTPSSILKKSKRESILMFCDATGKWGIFNTFQMILMFVALHFEIKFPKISKNVKDDVLIDLFIYQATGFIMLIMATFLSLILSHIIIYLNRSLDKHPDENTGEKAKCRKSIITFADNKILGSIFFRVIITILLFSSFILFILGSYLTSFTFDFYGFAGYLFKLLNIESHREFSIIDFGFKFPDSYDNPNSKKIIFAQLVYFLIVIIIPILHFFSLFILWLIPLTRKIQIIIYSISEILNAWSCLDVFIFSIIFGVQIGEFTNFIAKDKCGPINPFFKKYFNDYLDGHTMCIEVYIYLQNGCWILLISIIMYYIVSIIIMKICRNALYERLPKEVKDYLKDKKNQNVVEKIKFNDDLLYSQIKNEENEKKDLNDNNIKNN